LAFERGTKPFEGEGVFIYYGHRMTALAERLRQSRAHTAAANDDEFHETPQVKNAECGTMNAE
jgi:hypothetical protein